MRENNRSHDDRLEELIEISRDQNSSNLSKPVIIN